MGCKTVRLSVAFNISNKDVLLAERFYAIHVLFREKLGRLCGSCHVALPLGLSDMIQADGLNDPQIICGDGSDTNF